jgi:glycosyltransferase involved in cell wall biosynthesis
MKIIGLMRVYNEADILEENLNYLEKQGINLILLDGYSTDGSYEIAKKFLKKNIIKLKQQKKSTFSVIKLNTYLLKLIQEFNPDWVIWIDADEFLESPFRNLNLKEAIEQEARNDYNVIQFNHFKFWPTNKDPMDESNVRARLKFYSWVGDYRFKAWKWYPSTTYDDHKPTFPNKIEKKISPTKFVMRHYQIRSYEHGLRKIFEERMKRFDPQEKKMGWHKQYDYYIPEKNLFVIDSSKLTEYKEDGNWNMEMKYNIDLEFQRKLKLIGKADQKKLTSRLFSKPIKNLLDVYKNRDDLQRAFPEVVFGRNENLINWAASVVLGRFKDHSKSLLMPYANRYIILSQITKMKKLRHLKGSSSTRNNY